jgi:hypothetical protein
MSRGRNAARFTTKAARTRGIALGILRGLGVSLSAGGTGARFAGRLVGLVSASLVFVMVGFGLLAPAVSAAPKGVAAFFGNPAGAPLDSDLAGHFGTEGGTGVAVNSNPASEFFGDVYVVDTSFSRVQRFSSLGAFELMWGRDVIKPGSEVDTDLGNVAEVCTHAADCKRATEGPAGGEFRFPRGVSVDQATGNVYVVEGLGSTRVQAFGPDGEFLWAAGRNVVRPGGVGDVPQPPVLVAERQTVTLSDFDESFNPVPPSGGWFKLGFDPDGPGPAASQTTVEIAYNASAGVVQAALEGLAAIDPGEVIVTGANGGTWTVEFDGDLDGIDHQQMTADGSGLIGMFPSASVGTSQNGSTTPGGTAEVCTVASDCQEAAVGSKGGEFAAGGSMGPSVGGGNGIAVVPSGTSAPNDGNVLVTDRGNARVQEITSSGAFVRAFGFNTITNGSPSDPGNVTTFEICTVADHCRAGSTGSGTGQFGSNAPNRVAVDSTGAIYIVENSANRRVQKFTPAGANLTAAVVNPNIGGSGPVLNLTGTAFSSSPIDIAIGPSDRVLVVKNYPAGSGTPPSTVAERRVVELTNAGAYVETHAARSGLDSTLYLSVNTDSEEIYVTGTAAGGTSGVYVLGASSAPTVSLALGTVSSHTANLVGLVNPGGPDTEIGIHTKYHLEYRKIGAVSWTALTGDIDAGNGFDNVPVVDILEGLEAGTLYEAKLVASKPFSGLASIETAPIAFATPASRPDVDSAYVSDREATTTTLNARINPNNQATSYRFEYGPTAAYGTTIPVPDAAVGSGGSTAHVSRALTGLEPATTYHYRVVAVNASGTMRSADETFTTRPAVVGAEGRAFELVSPADKLGGGGVGEWSRSLARHVTSGVSALEGDRFASASFYGSSLTDGGFSYGSDWTLGQRTAAGWVNKPFFNRPGGFGTSEFAKVVGIGTASDDLSLMATSSASQVSLFEEQGAAWAGVGIGSVVAPALREWESGRWEIVGPVAPDQVAQGSVSVGLNQGGNGITVAPDGGYATLSGGIRGLEGAGDPTGVGFAGGPGDFVSGNDNVYLDDVSAGLSDTFPGAGIRSLVNVCTGAGASRTEIPVVDGAGKVAGGQCPPVLAGRDARLVSARGASVATQGRVRGHVSDDASRVFFMAPDHLKSENLAACVGTGAVDTECPPQLFVRQRNGDGSVAVRWISRSAVAGQDASLMSAAVFEGATPDGDKVFFRTASPLTVDDPNGGAQVPGGVTTGTADARSVDLYMYDFPDAPGADPGDGELTRISAGPTGSGDANVSTDSISSQTSALRAAGADGRRVYFTTAAPLAGVPGPASGTITSPSGTTSTTATRNLYVYDAGLSVGQRWRFIAQLPVGALGGCAATGSSGQPTTGLSASASNAAITAVPTHNCVRPNEGGSFVTFFTDGRLTADDPDSTTGDVYGYDADAGELVRISRAEEGVSEASYACTVTSSGAPGPDRCHGDLMIASSDAAVDPVGSTVFFESASRLVSEDLNGVYDVYRWQDGHLSLISTGAVGADDALLRGVDRTGANVYVSTRDRLSWQDHDAVLDVYVARVGGGIPEPAVPVVCGVLADGCQDGGVGRPTQPRLESDNAPAVGNMISGDRKTLSVGRPSQRARRVAARTGVLNVLLRTSGAGTVRAVARGRVGKRVRRVARNSIRLRRAGEATLRLRLNRAARQRLGRGGDLILSVEVRLSGAASRSITVRLPGMSS